MKNKKNEKKVKKAKKKISHKDLKQLKGGRVYYKEQGGAEVGSMN